MVERTEFHENRKTGIGGSDAAAILGISPWSDKMKVYMSKVAEGIPTDEETEPQYWGKKMEPLIRQKYREEVGLDVEFDGDRLLRHPEHKFMIGHCDGVVHDDDGPFGLEVKNSRFMRPSEWGDSWSDEIPGHYNIQCQHYMAVTGFQKFHLAVLFGGSEFRVYNVKRHEGVINHLIEQEAAFWDLVESRTPPPIDHSDSSKQYLLKAFPKNTEELLKPTPDFSDYATHYMAVMADANQAEEAMARCKHKMMEIIGPNKGVEGDAYKVTWTAQAGRKTINAKGLIADLNIPDDVVAVYTKIGEPTRRFLFKGKED